MECIRIDDSQDGRGMFAKAKVPAGIKLFKITGRPITFNDTKLLGDKESYCLQVDKELYLYPDYPFYYSNHSCEPNCGIDRDMNFITLRSIDSGEELRWDYSTSMMERHWQMKCDCGTPRCRKKIKDFDQLPLKTQQYYIGRQIVMPYIVAMMRKEEQ